MMDHAISREPIPTHSRLLVGTTLRQRQSRWLALSGWDRSKG